MHGVGLCNTLFFQKINIIKLVDGSLHVPQSGTPLREAREICNMKVISWMTQTMNAQIAQSVIYIEKARILCEDLREFFKRKPFQEISDLLQEIHSMRQGEHTNLH